MTWDFHARLPFPSYTSLTRPPKLPSTPHRANKFASDTNSFRLIIAPHDTDDGAPLASGALAPLLPARAAGFSGAISSTLRSGENRMKGSDVLLEEVVVVRS
jgi:hypothetical protein